MIGTCVGALFGLLLVLPLFWCWFLGVDYLVNNVAGVWVWGFTGSRCFDLFMLVLFVAF